MAEIEIFLNLPTDQIHFLSIPRRDIERLAVRPFRWIRYVMFAICGARGDLSTTPNGPAVDYDNTQPADAENAYYYQPSEECVFVDHQGLNDRLTSSAHTSRSSNFRTNVIRRDGHACVVTEDEEGACDAAHLIPRSKGDEYIAKVIQLRSPRDSSEQPSNVGSPGNNLEQLSDIGIDDIRNGLLLRKDLHAMLGLGNVAFIKTPNYELQPEDIKRFSRGNPRQKYITLHRLKEPVHYNPGHAPQLGAAIGAGANIDALFQGEGVPQPSTVILDYVYGVAAYNSWKSKLGSVANVMDQYHRENYAHIPPIPHAPSDDLDDSDGPSEPDPSNDSDYKPPEPRKHRTPTTRRGESDLGKAMDELNLLLMYVNGVTPEQVAERRQKEIEQEERAAQEASRSKVMEWRKYTDVN